MSGASILKAVDLMALPSTQVKVFSGFGLMVWASGLALSWLLPVAIQPWTTFAADVWVAIITLIAAAALLWGARAPIGWHSISCWVAALVLLPWLQYAFGLLPFAGQAWMSSLYLLGFLLALLVGAAWEKAAPLQLANALLLAIGVAAIGSVGLQLYAWTGVAESGGLGVLFSGLSSVRPSANLGQPNQLATFLLWGVVACFWAYQRQLVGVWTGVLVLFFLLTGLALTQSRTGVLAATVLLAGVWFWRSLWRSRALPWAATAGYLYLLIVPLFLGWLNSALLLEPAETFVRVHEQSELRLSAWRLFAQAVLQRPWFGYGWIETAAAQMDVANQFASLRGVFSHSHNLLLDLALWCGLPIGLLVSMVLVRWFWQKLRRVTKPADAALMMILVVVGIHALLEFPLQYAYFLLPAGLAMGILNTRLGIGVVWSSPRGTLIGLWLVAVVALGVTVRDYVEVQASYNLLRLEQGLLGQNRPPLGGPPDVTVLTHLREWIVASREKPRAAMSPQELADMQSMARQYPSRPFAYRLATALALNDRPDEARVWLEKICKFTDAEDCQLAQRSWAQDAGDDPRLAKVQWVRKMSAPSAIEK